MEGARLILRNALLELIGSARSRRPFLAMDAPDRQFFLGVEAAAEQTLRPEMASARTEAWLARQDPAFREGYEETMIVIAAAQTAEMPPLRLRLPEPPAPLNVRSRSV